MGFIGLQLIWWHGVVEDINDPLKLGRVRVRIFGMHTENKQILPTESLPWAVPIHPLSSAATSGVGFSATGMVNGGWVMGFFRDGKEAQEPIIFGSIAGIPEVVANTKLGFNDPDGVYPKEELLNEPDTNRLARGQNLADTLLQEKTDSQEKYIPTGLGDEWTEPASPYAAVYPHNKVFQTESGHTIELDDTPGAERIHVYHKSGSFFEIHPDGTNITKVRGNNYQIVLSDNRILIKGDNAINVDGDTKFRGNNVDIEIANNARIFVAGDLTSRVNGSWIQSVKGDIQILSEGNILIASSGRVDINPDGIDGTYSNPGYNITTPSSADESTDQLGYVESVVNETTVVAPDYGEPNEKVDYGNISDLGDTAITTLNSGETLVWNGETWAGRNLRSSEIEWDTTDLGIIPDIF